MESPDVSVWKLARRGVRMRWMRLLLTILSVAGGVAFFTGTSIVSSSVRTGFSDLFAQFNEGVDFQVRSIRVFGDDLDGRPLLDESLAERISSVEVVRRVDPVLFREAIVLGGNGPVVPAAGPSALIAVPEEPLPGVQIRSGRAPRDADEAVLDTRTARLLGIADDLPADAEVLVGNRRLEFSIVGTIAQAGAEDYLGAVIVGVHPSEASNIAGTPGRVDALAVVLEPDASPQAFSVAVRELLGKDVEAVPGATVVDEQLAVLNRFLGPFSTALIGFAVVALFVAGFIVTNTFSIGVSQRLRELAVMKAIGASGRQLTAMVILEALLVGVLASALGIAAGWGVARGIVGLLSGGGGFPDVPLSIETSTVVAAAAVGTALTTVSSLRPALRAGRLSPMAAFADAAGPGRSVRPVRSLLVFVAGSLLFLAGTLGGAEGRSALALSGIGSALLFAAVPGVGSLLVPPLARAAKHARRNSVVWTLASENARRGPRRIAAAAAAMTVGLSLVAAVTVVGASVAATLDASFDDNLSASHVARTETQGPGGIPTEYSGELRRSGAFAHVVGVTRSTVKAGETGRSVSAVDPEGFADVFALDLRGGALELGEDTVALDSETATALQVAVGDQLDVTHLNGTTANWEVVAVFEDPGLLLSGMVTSKTTMRKSGLPAPSDRYVVAGGARPDWETVAAGVNATYPQVSLQTVDEFGEERGRQIDQLLGVVNALLALTVLVAAIGIANTLSLTVLERHRELGLLRAVGADRGQVRAVVRVEALLVGLLGGVSGTVLGVGIGVLLTHALPQALTGVLAVPGGRIGALTIAGVFTGIAAAWWPARKAARSDILAAVTVD